MSNSEIQIERINHHKKRRRQFLAAAVLGTIGTVGLGYSAVTDFKEAASLPTYKEKKQQTVSGISKAAGTVLLLGITSFFGVRAHASYRRLRRHRSGEFTYRDGKAMNYEEPGGPE